MKKSSENNELYLKVWGMDKNYLQARWTITTFFMSISFAILGFSLSSPGTSPVPVYVRLIAGLFIYWFAYFLNLRFYDYTEFLRDYLEKLEESNTTTLDIQTKTKQFMENRGRPSTKNLLLYFGLLYTIGVFIIWLVFLR